MALCKFVVSLANILFIVHFKVSSETRFVLTVVPNYTSRLLRGFESRPNFLGSLVIPTFWGGDLIVFVDLFLFFLGRIYFNLSSPDVLWDQLNVSKIFYCGIKVTGSFIFKTENSSRLKTSREG